MKKLSALLQTKMAKWGLSSFVVLSVLLCAGELKNVGEPRPIHIQIINGFIMAILLNITLIVSLTRIASKFRYLIILPLALSGVGVAFVVWGYHVTWIPAVLILYSCAGFRLFTESID